VRVQGEGSAIEIAAAIEGFNALPEAGVLRRPDLLIVARGGGSLEDLWSFNEEIVVRAAAASLIPLISAVGHETDVTLIDFAADRRAPTPTAAAEMAVPVRSELMLDVESLARRAAATWRRNQEARRNELRSAVRALPGPDEILAVPRQRLDHAAQSLRRALRANAQIHHVGFSRIAGRLNPHLLRSNVERRRERFAGIAQRLRSGVAANIEAYRTRLARERERTGVLAGRAQRAVRNLIATRRARSERGGQLLAAFSYRGVLARGFALVRDAAGHPLRAAAAVSAGMAIEIEFSDGRIGAHADGAAAPEKSVADPPKPRTRRDGGSGQGNLF
jgi:exodeoxyribonuclease VII large subunit